MAGPSLKEQLKQLLLPIYGYEQQIGLKSSLANLTPIVLMNYLKKLKALPWEDYLPLDAEFPVAGKSIKSKLYSVPDCQAITKKPLLTV